MIAFLKGKLVSKNDYSVTILAGGIGWKVFLTRDALKKMPQLGREVKLWTWLYTRQDGMMELYGFLREEEEELFEVLNNVAGIGPKTALAVLDASPIEKLKAAIASGDASILSRVSGVGAKSSQRIILELKNKFKQDLRGKDSLAIDLEVEDTLVSLGYSRREARQSLAKVPDSLRGMKDRLRATLKILGGKR